MEKRKIIYQSKIDDDESEWKAYESESYDYDFSKSYKDKEKEMADYWKSWKETGEWKGYQFQSQPKPQLDYKYIEQMANAFSAKFNVECRAGNHWSADPDQKILTYDSLSLVEQSKAFLITCLLHEIGHIKYTTSRNKLNCKYFKKFPDNDLIFQVINVFEDFRIDEIMSKSYAGASEAYKSLGETAKEIKEKLLTRSNERNLAMARTATEQILKMKGNFLTQAEQEKILKTINQFENIEDYMASMTIEGYGEKVDFWKGDLQKRVNQTRPAINQSRKAKTTQELVDILDEKVFPVIEDLLETNQQGEQENKKMIEELMKIAKEMLEGTGKKLNEKLLGNEINQGIKNIKSFYQNNPFGGMTDTINEKSRLPMGKAIPQKWIDGDYQSLKESISSSIKRLIKRMNFIKADDMTQKFESKKRFGKIDMKRIARFANHDFRIFKRRIESIDRVKSYCFSILVDKSGSMEMENKSINATKGAIILAETFKKMDIPLEVIKFGSFSELVKSFEMPLDKTKKKIGGLVNAHDGYTRIHDGLQSSKILERAERKKIMVIITDGFIGDKDYANGAIKRLKKAGVEFAGLAISTDNERGNLENLMAMIGKNCKEIFQANDIADSFAELAENIISGKRAEQ